MSGVLTDLRGTWRLLRRRPALMLLALVVLALGIGANTAIFTVARGVLLRPLPYQDPDRLVMLWRAPREQSSTRGVRDAASVRRGIATPEMVREYRARNSSLADIAAVESWQGNLSPQMDLVIADGAERLRGAHVTPNFFAVLGVQPSLGRTFTTEDDGDLIVVSDNFWRRRLGANPGIVGSTIDLASGDAIGSGVHSPSLASCHHASSTATRKTRRCGRSSRGSRRRLRPSAGHCCIR